VNRSDSNDKEDVPAAIIPHGVAWRAKYRVFLPNLLVDTHFDFCEN
jgi:hypothetical protein